MSVHRFMVRLSSSMTRRNRLKKWIENSNRSEKELEDAEPSQVVAEQRELLSAVARASPELGEERLALDAAGRRPHNRRTPALRGEAIMPYSRRANQVGVFPQRGECELRFLRRNETAAAANYLAHAIEKKWRALHDAAAQHDGIRCIKVDQIGEAQAQVEGLTFDGLQGEFISLLSQFADTLRGDAFAMRITRRHVPG
jgi:hypothetical protein